MKKLLLAILVVVSVSGVIVAAYFSSKDMFRELLLQHIFLQKILHLKKLRQL